MVSASPRDGLGLGRSQVVEQAERAERDDPVPVHIDDLANPHFPPEAGPLLAGMDAMADDLVLEPDALVEVAVARTGLEDFGPTRYREGLEVLCRALADDVELAPRGVVNVHTQIVQLLVNRLLVTDLLARQPEIHDLDVVAPIVVAGLPRTGTTHLHQLLALDPALRSLPYWESLEPVLPESELPPPGAPDPRIERTQVALGALNMIMPYFRRMHEMTVDHAHEEIQLLALDFSTMFFEALVPLPTYRDWYRATDQTAAYEHLRTMLKVLQWTRGGARWVLKSPQHLEQLPTLRRVFPDATVVLTHRDPVAITTSMATMAAYAARVLVDRPDPVAIGAYWAARVEDLLRACVRDRDDLSPERSTDVRFVDFMADELGTLGRVCALAGQPESQELRRTRAAYLERHQRGRHGRVRYEPSDVGLDVDERRAALRFYSERFGLASEV